MTDEDQNPLGGEGDQETEEGGENENEEDTENPLE